MTFFKQYWVWDASGNGRDGSEAPIIVPHTKTARDDVRWILDKFYGGQGIVHAIDINGDEGPIDPEDIPGDRFVD